MNRRHFMMLPGAAFLFHRESAQGQPAQQAGGTSSTDLATVLPDQLLLKDYRPKSIYKIPKTDIKKSKFPCFDLHHHARAKTPGDVDNEIRIMDAVGMERSVVFSGGTGAVFDACHKLYSRYPKRFDVYCHLDMRDSDKPGFGPAAVKEIERCHRMGARGIGEIHDKGMGVGGVMAGPPNWQGTRPGRGGQAQQQRPAFMGPHPDDPRMDGIWEKAADLGMPINLHMSDPYWSYLPQDRNNDGLMNGFSWRMDNKPGVMGHNDLVDTFERTAKRHPRTVFIASHLLNLDYDLTRLGGMFDRNPNLYADFSARFCETATIPRFVNQFLKKYADRVVYGTDMPFTQEIFSATFRILESVDEHFYEQDLFFNFNYHWPMHGFGLPDDVLKNVYRDSALNAIKQAQNNAKA